MQGAPVRTFVTHGEPAAADALRRRIADTLHWSCEVPVYEQCVDLNEGDEGDEVDGLHQGPAEAAPADATQQPAGRSS
jgi:metallo-beta-lactamase family protein